MDNHSAGEKRGRFYFDPDDPIYRDHFPGRPVVPGSLIIHAFIRALGMDSKAIGLRTAINFRFKHFVSPGSYTYRMVAKADGRTACFLYDQEKTVVTGTL